MGGGPGIILRWILGLGSRNKAAMEKEEKEMECRQREERSVGASYIYFVLSA